jgi:hypothetical protein
MPVQHFPDCLDVVNRGLGPIVHHDAGDDTRSERHDDSRAHGRARHIGRNAIRQEIETRNRNRDVNDNVTT